MHGAEVGAIISIFRKEHSRENFIFLRWLELFYLNYIWMDFVGTLLVKELYGKFDFFYMYFWTNNNKKKLRIQETLNLSVCAVSSTDAL